MFVYVYGLSKVVFNYLIKILVGELVVCCIIVNVIVSGVFFSCMIKFVMKDEVLV